MVFTDNNSLKTVSHGINKRGYLNSLSLCLIICFAHTEFSFTNDKILCMHSCSIDGNGNGNHSLLVFIALFSF